MGATCSRMHTNKNFHSDMAPQVVRICYHTYVTLCMHRKCAHPDLYLHSIKQLAQLLTTLAMPTRRKRDASVPSYSTHCEVGSR